MSSTKETSTTKTAHVMNLLRKTIPAEPETTASETPQQTTAPAQPQNAPQTPPIITSIQEEAEVSNQIKNALEDALSAADVAVPEPAEAEIHATPEPEEVQPPQPEPEPPAAEPEAEPVAESEPVASEPEPEAPAPPLTVELTETATTDVDTNAGVLTYVNVMQTLVDEKAPKYMKMFGLCECPRCQADVKAIALNRLDPKYVVMPKDGVIPRLTLYEGQYSSAVIAQLLYACKVVMESPRHDR